MRCLLIYRLSSGQQAAQDLCFRCGQQRQNTNELFKDYNEMRRSQIKKEGFSLELLPRRENVNCNKDSMNGAN